MTATAAQIARLRRMVNEPSATSSYTDDDLRDYIHQYPCLDEQGEAPYTIDTSTTPPHRTANTGWLPTYDLHAAAADIYEEKAAVVAQDFDFSADGGNYSRSQAYEHYMKQARYHRSRRKISTVRLVKWPEEETGSTLRGSWIVNLAEPND